MVITAATSAGEAQAPEAACAGRASAAPAFDGALFDGEDGVPEDHARANWSVPWSDLMMTMFVLFAVLLAMHTMRERSHAPGPGERAAVEPVPVTEYRDRVEERVVERVAPVAEPQPEEQPSRRAGFEPPVQVNVLERSEQAVRETNLRNAEIVLLDDKSVKVSVQGPMFFALGKADLKPEVTRFLDRLAQVIRQTPYEIHVVGHTDDLPISTVAFPSNWELSLVRASQVARYLIRSGGLAPSRFVVMGRGEYEPAAANGEERSRALNRRVEIIITRTVTQSEAERRR